MANLRILVVSDLHANVDRMPAKANDTYVIAEPPTARPNCNPLGDLEDWLTSANEDIDYVMVPGDIANQDDAKGLEYAWSRLAALAQKIDARLIGSPGNHDVTTHSYAADPRANLKSLDPTFPTLDPAVDTLFWDQGWALVDHDPDHRILVLDSTAAFPPFPAGVNKRTTAYKAYMAELDRGTFSETTEDALEMLFRTCSPKLNIAMVHHHPIEHQNVSHLRDSYGAMNRGGDLIDLLSRHASMGRWIIVHGHKHIPQLVNAVSATANGPLVLCAASLGHKLWPPINTVVRNQFHILEATNDPTPGLGTVRGEVRSYFWGYGVGWQPAEQVGSGLPAQAGFGCSDDPRTLGDQIIAHMDNPLAPLDLIRADRLLARFPQLRFQLPADAKFLREYLESSGFQLTDHRGQLVQLGRAV